MKNVYPSIAVVIALQLFALTPSIAQSNGDLSVLKAPLPGLAIDGNVKDWGDSLQYFNAESNVRYGLSNDKENLYFAIKIDEPVEAARVLRAGITLSFDPKGKNSSAYSITFPLNTQQVGAIKTASTENPGEITQADRDELHREMITSLRGIKVEGFKDIEGDMITTSNAYGIKAALDYDAKGNLICEAAIPLKFFHLDEHSKTEWIFDVKINSVNRTGENAALASANTAGMGGRGGMGGGRGGMGGSGMGGRGGRGGNRAGNAGNASEGGGVLAKPIDFSGKFYLSNGQ